MTRLIGVDLGERRIGLAVGETESGSARSLAVVSRRTLDQDAAFLARLLVEQGASELVVGLPRSMDGSQGAQAIATRTWVAAIRERLSVSIALRDERLTTVAAESGLGRPSRGRSGGPPSRAARVRRRGAVDREAARLILQAELDARAARRDAS